jgi:glycosyltransferase involved in cell wall biosynthesis
MRILVHDYSGHPFQVQLSRALAARGHEVRHIHCASFNTGKGALARTDADPAGFDVESIDLGKAFERYNLATRLRQEVAYGGAFAARAAAFRPDVVLSSNDPLFAKWRAAMWCARAGVPWVFWLQDVYSIAMGNYAREKVPLAGPAIGRSFEVVERRLSRRSASVVAITDDFRPLLREWGVPDDRIAVIENWAPLTELAPAPRHNAWSAEHDLDGARVVLYSGTLGLKHDPSMLSELARRVRSLDGDVRVVVVSEGIGADWLIRERERSGVDNLLVLPYQPWERMGEMLGTADVLVSILEKDAGVFSVPSKVLTYLCAGRAMLGAIPAENLAARTIERAGAGVVVAPDHVDAFCAAAMDLLRDDARRAAYGAGARAYAEQAFDIGRITDSFEQVLEAAARTQRGAVGTP